MLNNIWFIVAFWTGLAFLASLISIRLGVLVALVEILAGAEIDPASLRANASPKAGNRLPLLRLHHRTLPILKPVLYRFLLPEDHIAFPATPRRHAMA
jgi:hypothetical protein